MIGANRPEKALALAQCEAPSSKFSAAALEKGRTSRTHPKFPKGWGVQRTTRLILICANDLSVPKISLRAHP